MSQRRTGLGCLREGILGQNWVRKKKFFGRDFFFFFVFLGFLGSFFSVLPSRKLPHPFTFEKMPVCLVFFRVFVVSLLGDVVAYTGLGDEFWARFGSEKKIFFGRDFFFFFTFWDVLGCFFCVLPSRKLSYLFT